MPAGVGGQGCEVCRGEGRQSGEERGDSTGHSAHDCPKPKVQDAKYIREQMLLAMKDEAGGTLNDEENDFMLENAYGDETLEELTAATLGKLFYVTPLNTNTAVKAMKVSNTEVEADRSKPVTSHSTPKNEQSQKQSANVIERGMYRITKTETHTPVTKTNISVSNSTSVESSNSVRRPQSKDNKSKKRVLKNTNIKSTSTNVRKFSDSIVKSTLFTSHVAAKSRNLGTTFVVAKSRFSVAKPSTATNKVSSASSLSPESSQSGPLCNYMKNKIATSRKWQK
ncbi:hypothetical protein Tco_1515281 [Tanacetum coccineum]